jgi:hypothetical protein
MFGSHLTPRSYEATRSTFAVMHPVCPRITRRRRSELERRTSLITGSVKALLNFALSSCTGG